MTIIGGHSSRDKMGFHPSGRVFFCFPSLAESAAGVHSIPDDLWKWLLKWWATDIGGESVSNTRLSPGVFSSFLEVRHWVRLQKLVDSGWNHFRNLQNKRLVDKNKQLKNKIEQHFCPNFQPNCPTIQNVGRLLDGRRLDPHSLLLVRNKWSVINFLIQSKLLTVLCA